MEYNEIRPRGKPNSAALLKDMRDYLGTEIRIDFDYVAEIPGNQTANSGKSSRTFSMISSAMSISV